MWVYRTEWDGNGRGRDALAGGFRFRGFGAGDFFGFCFGFFGEGEVVLCVV